jgi:hypothetical protein
MQEMDEIWACLGGERPAMWLANIDGVTAPMALGWGVDAVERWRWHVVFRIAI